LSRERDGRRIAAFARLIVRRLVGHDGAIVSMRLVLVWLVACGCGASRSRDAGADMAAGSSGGGGRDMATAAPAGDLAAAGLVTDDRYVLDEDPDLRNPERGITYWDDNEDPGNDVHALRNHFLWLGDACDQPLAWHGRGDAGSSAVLRDWADTAVALAARGYKVVFRPRYDTPAAQGALNRCGKLEADSWARLHDHVDAIAAMLGDDELRPIVAFVEMGYLGSWGEWNGAGTGCAPDIAACRAWSPVLFAASVGQDRISWVRDVAARYAAAGLLRPIGLRRPQFHRDAAVAYQVAPARLGFYDDCFAVDDDTDAGTFSNIESDFTAGSYAALYPASSFADVATARAYFETNAAFGTQGGETCNTDPAHSESWYQNPAGVLTRLESDRFSYLHAAYATGFRERMIAAGAWDELRSRLGYRFAVTSVRYTPTAAPGAPVTVSVTIANSGYAGIAFERLAYVVLHGPSDYVVGARDPELAGATLLAPSASSGEHVQAWTREAPAVFTQTFAAPTTPGSYALQVAIPDVDCIGNAYCNQQLRRDYAVRFATRRDGQALFDASRGSNDLGVPLTVAAP
jgi:hypothetical protein